MGIKDVTNRMVQADYVCDFIPVVSSVSNLVDLFQKCAVLPFMKGDTIKESHYFKYIQKKEFARCFCLLIPFVGNIIVGIYDSYKSKPTEKGKTPEIARTLPNEYLIGPEKPTQEEKLITVGDVLPIDTEFTKNKTIDEQREAHDKAKAFLKREIEQIGGTIEFVSSMILSGKCPNVDEITINKAELDRSIFGWQYTSGVDEDIIRDGNREEDSVVIYTAASQFNGCEAPGKYTVPPGEAVDTYQNDPTQGPKAQLAFNPKQVEIINCGGNIGYNGLCRVLDEETKDQVAHGYFCPSQERKEALIKQLQEKGGNIEYPLVASIPRGGSKKVHMMLVAAPAFAEGYNKSFQGKEFEDQKKQIQFLCALHAFRAQFWQCSRLALMENKPVCLKATAVGLGVFGNDPEVVAKAFYTAAKEYTPRLLEKRVKVILQIYKGSDGKPNLNASKMAGCLFG